MNSPLQPVWHQSFGPPTHCHRTGGTPAKRVAVGDIIEVEGLLGSGRMQVN
jgi:hypothetical protein